MRSFPLKVTVTSWKLGVYMADNRKSRRERERKSDCLQTDRLALFHTGRLEDKSSIVRRAALQLLTALLLYNPFGGELPEGRFEASLTEWKAKLKVCRCTYLLIAT